MTGILLIRPLPDADAGAGDADAQISTAARALELPASPSFAQRPAATPEEVQRRIAALRSDWDEH